MAELERQASAAVEHEVQRHGVQFRPQQPLRFWQDIKTTLKGCRPQRVRTSRTRVEVDSNSPNTSSLFRLSMRSLFEPFQQAVERVEQFVFLFRRVAQTLVIGSAISEIFARAARDPTIASYEWIVKKCIEPVIGKIPLTKLTQADLNEFMLRRLKAGLSPRTVQYCHAVIRSAVTKALKDGLVSRNVANVMVLFSNNIIFVEMFFVILLGAVAFVLPVIATSFSGSATKIGTNRYIFSSKWRPTRTRIFAVTSMKRCCRS